MARVPITDRILTRRTREIEFSVEPAINLSDDTVFQFLSEEYEGLSPASSVDDNNIGDVDEENENRCAVDCNFWDNQHVLLQSTLHRTTSLE